MSGRWSPRCSRGGFTLAEILVAGAVLALLVLFMTRVVNHAAAVVTQGNKHMDAEAYGRALFDRMAVDVAQMVKRTDISYYLKNSGTGPGSSADIMGSGVAGAAKNDRLAFFSAGSGYYDTTKAYNSSYSLVSYRVNTDPTSASYNRVERMGKGLPLNGAYTPPPTATDNTVTPLLFLDSSYATTIGSVWPAATSPSPDPNYYPTDGRQKYELVGAHVFRLEYYYLTSGSPQLVAYPGSWTDWNPVSANISDDAAIVVAVGVIDPQSRKLLGATIADQEAQIANIAKKLADYTSTLPSVTGCPAVGQPGALLCRWQNVLQTDPEILSMPRPAIQGVRFYERYFYLNQ
jgi:type II secretory pathway component PulJ